jgi:hypothetical protein
MVRYAAPMSLARVRILFFIATIFVILIVSSAPAAAQADEPIPHFTIDARGSLAFYGQNDEIAASLAVARTTMPSRGLGFEVGAHVYPFRYRAITFGIGASFHASGAENTPPIPQGQTQSSLPSVRARFRAFNPQLSFNFGKRDGWSYISGGMGTTTLAIQRVFPNTDPAGDEGRRAKTINYGGGARWFTSDHLAFTVDVRFYAISPLAGISTEAARPRMTLVVVNVGAGFK